jgi:hypothetical protein
VLGVYAIMCFTILHKMDTAQVHVAASGGCFRVVEAFSSATLEGSRALHVKVAADPPLLL